MIFRIFGEIFGCYGAGDEFNFDEFVISEGDVERMDHGCGGALMSDSDDGVEVVCGGFEAADGHWREFEISK